jgi:hypothetical protein
VRLCWMVFGPLLMLISFMVIVSTPQWTFGLSDALMASGAMLSVATRYLDIHSFQGQTANGEPATGHVFRRYLVGLSTLVVAMWVAAQSVAI